MKPREEAPVPGWEGLRKQILVIRARKASFGFYQVWHEVPGEGCGVRA